MSHIVLLGDSIFDNASYVQGGPAVIDQVRQNLQRNDKATLLAVDGDVTADVEAQLQKLPQDASHLIVSVGGNDALGQAGLLREEAQSVAEVMLKFSAVAKKFEHDYERMMRGVLDKRLPTAACTIYFPRFSDASIQALSVAGLTFFNDAIIRVAFKARVPIIDLRLICTEHGDYANDIEPSSQGGAKIASVIAQVVAQHNFEAPCTGVYF